MEKEEEKISLDTMAGVGKVKEIAGREYTILPVNIRDMHYILGSNEGTQEGETRSDTLYLVEKEDLEKDNYAWQLFGINIIDKKRKEIFMKVINKYVFYKDHPMTEELLIEHNWSFKEIGKFLLFWCQLSD